MKETIQGYQDKMSSGPNEKEISIKEFLRLLWESKNREV